MTGPAARGTERGTRAPSRVTGTQGAVGAVLVVLALGLALRLIIAYLLPGSGFGVDLGAFRAWAINLAAEGLHGFYQRDFFHDYTPGYLYVLWVLGLIGQVTGGVGVALIKVPAILADLAIGWLVWSMILELGGRRSVALLAAFVAVVNPVSWFDSVVWGQVDSVGVVFLLLGLREMWRDHPERAAIYAVVAALIKPQLGILIPILAFVTIRRAFWPVSDPDDQDDVADALDLDAALPADEPPADGWLARVRAWERRTDHPIRVVTTGAVALVTTVLLCLPFGLSVIEFSSTAPYVSSGLLSQIFATASGYPFLTVNAFNPWALVAGDTGSSLANAGVWVCDGPWGAEACAFRGLVVRRRPGSAHRVGADPRGGGRGLTDRRLAPGSGHDPDLPHGHGHRLLRRPDTSPRALCLSGLRAGDHPRCDRLALAHRLRCRDDDGLPQHVRGPDQPVLRQPGDQRLAGDRADPPRRGRRGPHRAGERRHLPVGDRAAAPERPDPLARRAGPGTGARLGGGVPGSGR